MFELAEKHGRITWGANVWGATVQILLIHTKPEAGKVDLKLFLVSSSARHCHLSVSFHCWGMMAPLGDADHCRDKARKDLLALLEGVSTNVMF